MGRTLRVILVVLAWAGTAPAEELKEYRSEAGRFRVLLPPGALEEEQKTPAGPMHLLKTSGKDVDYLVSWIDLAAPPGAAVSPQERLDRTRDAVVRGVRGTLSKETKLTLAGKFPGRELLIATAPPRDLIRHRLYLVDGRLYQVVVWGTKEWAGGKEADAVLDSFALAK
jgi:hypothetical protein